MADLTTLAGIEAELADTADSDATLDVSKAKRRAAALRRKLDFPQSTGHGEQNIAFAMQTFGHYWAAVLNCRSASNVTTPTAFERFRLRACARIGIRSSRGAFASSIEAGRARGAL